MTVRPLITRLAVACLSIAATAASPVPAFAQIAVSANDNKLTLIDGVQTVVRNPAPDTVTILDLGGVRPKVLGEVRAPTSIIGPPSSVAVAPDGSIALVTAATRIDPADPTKTIADNVVTVIDLKASPPAVVATLHAGSGASGVSINRLGSLALVANRMEGSVSVFTISGRTVAAAGKVDLGAPDSGPSAVVFSRDGRHAFVTRNNDSLISVLLVDGSKVTYPRRDLGAGFKPYGIEVAPAGDVAIVGHIGAGQNGGGVDVISVIDLTGGVARAVSHVNAGPTVEAVAISPDGRYVAATVMNGSNAAKSSPLYNDFGLLKIFALSNKALTPLAEAKIGHWCQGVAWSRDSLTLLVQCIVEREIQILGFDGRRLTASAPVKVSGGPAGIRTN